MQKQASTTDKPDAATDKAVADKPEDKEAAVGGQAAAAKVAAPRETKPETRPEAKVEAPKAAEQPTPREPAGLKGTGPVSEAEVKALRGASARVVTNMESSLQVPTATSVRAVPAKLLIDNRVVINNHLKRSRGGKVSFTHLIGYALVKALAVMPEMNNGFTTDEKGKPALLVPAHVNLGLAIDVRQGGRHPPAAGAEHQVGRDDGLRPLLDRLRGRRPQGPRQQAHRRGLRGHHDLADQPGHHRHGPLGAAPDGRARARSSASARWTTPPSGRAPARRRSTATPSPRS